MVPAVWSGFIRLGDLTIAATAFTALTAAKSIKLRQVHNKCLRPIRMKKFCPEHGELKSNEIVKVFEHSPGQFTPLDAYELSRLKAPAERTLDLEEFVPRNNIDPTFYGGSAYYLVPAAFHAQHPFRALRQAMIDEQLCGLAQVVLRGKESLVLVSPFETLLVMSRLHFAKRIRSTAMFDMDLATGPIPTQQLAIAHRLVRERRIDHPHLERFRDLYGERSAALIAEKIPKNKDRARLECQEQLTAEVNNGLRPGKKRRANRPRRSEFHIHSQHPMPLPRKSG